MALRKRISFFISGQAMKLAGSEFPDQGLNHRHISESAKSQQLDCQGTELDVREILFPEEENF